MSEKEILAQLIAMSRELGRPENDYVILGEGNTSAKIDEEHFFVKASGKYLADSDENTFVKVKLNGALAILDKDNLTDDQIKELLFAACADPDSSIRPSIETTFHAFLLSLPGVNFVGHTHPTPILAMMCSINAENIIRGRICPEEIVFCGPESVYVEYGDPGLALGKKIRESVYRYIDKHGCNPKVIYVQNHGLIALAGTADEVIAATAVACKAARALTGAMIFGGVRYLPEEDVERIYVRPDEAYRLEQLKRARNR
ncbi:MAG: class II aldolase/adducin family protein [Armatimonadota bacterium]|nr:class II aldolase/adducin family protein [Armatimonadota bacterium]